MLRYRKGFALVFSLIILFASSGISVYAKDAAGFAMTTNTVLARADTSMMECYARIASKSKYNNETGDSLGYHFAIGDLNDDGKNELMISNTSDCRGIIHYYTYKNGKAIELKAPTGCDAYPVYGCIYPLIGRGSYAFYRSGPADEAMPYFIQEFKIVNNKIKLINVAQRFDYYNKADQYYLNNKPCTAKKFNEVYTAMGNVIDFIPNTKINRIVYGLDSVPAPAVSIVKSKELTKGQSYVLKLKNANGWKIIKSSTENKKIVAIKKTTSNTVNVTAKKLGSCKITVKVKKNSKVKTLKCQFQVVKKKTSQWKNAYRNYIANNRGGEDVVYKLVKINGDKVPELFINYGITADGGKVCAFQDGRLIVQDVWNYGFSYIEGKNLFIDSGGHMDVYHDVVYTIKNGSFRKIFDGAYGAPDNSHVQVDENNEPIYEYFVNDKRVSSEKEYLKALKKVYDSKHESNPFSNTDYDSSLGRRVGNGLCGYEEIIQAINNYS